MAPAVAVLIALRRRITPLNVFENRTLLTNAELVGLGSTKLDGPVAEARSGFGRADIVHNIIWSF